jgi:hypothetical protein
MKSIMKSLAALVAAVMLASCGGGGSGDSMPPPQTAQAAPQGALGASRSPQRALSYTLTASQLLDWAEGQYSGLFSPQGATNQTSGPYTFRYYSATSSYLGVVATATAGATVGDVFVWHPGVFNGALTRVGNLTDFECTVNPSHCTVPDAPTIGTATAGNTTATVAFTAPASDGGLPITEYSSTCTSGLALTSTGTATASPITVANLVNGTLYSCSVKALNSVGYSLASAAVTVTPSASTNTGTTTGTASTTPLLSLTANSTISLDTCGGTVGTGVPDFYRNYFMCSNRSLSADGHSVVITTYGLPPHSSPYYPSSHPNYVDFAVDRAGQVCAAGVPLGTNGCHVKNPSTLAQQSVTLTIPLEPVAKGIDVNANASQIDNTSSDHYDYSGAVMGVAINGVVLFSAFAAPGDDINTESYTFDSHEGHPQGDGAYHHHKYAPGPLEVLRKAGYTTSVTPGSPSGGIELYGITCDGVLIFGVTELDGTTPAGILDAQGGHTHDVKDTAGTLHFSSRYHVHLSPSAIGSNTKAYTFMPELQYYSTCNSSGG